MHNLYNVLYKKPALEKWEMPYELEDLARKIVLNGRFRIDADEQSNFVRFSHPAENINMVFSYRELCDPRLIPRTMLIIKSALSVKYRNKELKDKTQSEYERLKDRVTKIFGIDTKTELKLARAITQSIDPCVILLMLAEGAELFISYSHQVGDMLDIQSWQTVGSSSGLQSSNHMESGVFVSCDGNPFLPEKYHRHEGDGFPAIARMIIIAGQELGHFSDIIRDKQGRKRSRFSSNLQGTRAKKPVHIARQHDMQIAAQIQHELENIGIKKIRQLERDLKFFKKHKRRDITKINTQRKANNLTRKLLKKLHKKNLKFLTTVKPDEDKHLASQIYAMILDMRFNLNPKADAYKRDDPEEENAVACIEALARVPQQVNKWGHNVVKHISPNLYDIYYNEVIPTCIRSYENATGHKYHFKITKKSLFVRLWQRFLTKS